ncbi:S41 family peptidase [Candidatus Saccharibacteria bacterium]|nr:S41 family peptidase [Candidatus Saccharibacteria bacterium]
MANSARPASRRPVARLILVGLVAFGLGLGVSIVPTRLGLYPWVLTGQNQINLTQFWQVNDILRQKFDGSIDAKKQAQGAVAGMVAALGDPYTTYLTAEQNKDLNDQLKGTLSGVGIEVGIKNNRLTVIAPVDGTPAARAGIRAGDLIAAIDGKDSSALTTEQAVKMIRGQAGTQVKLIIVRPGQQPNEITLTREQITVPSVTTEVKAGNIGYIKIREFGANTVQSLENATQALMQQGVRAAVIDLRDNPGGYLDGAVKVSSQFMANGTVVEERSIRESSKKFKALPGGNMTTIPIVVLVNGGSASASEITAGALSDNQRATLVGEKTFGKGSVQEVICLGGFSLASTSSENCSTDALKVTVANWFTPNGINISKEGITPNVEVKLTQDDYNAGRDPQLQKALEVAGAKVQ